MPSVSKRFMGAELGRRRAGKKTRTGMNEAQLEEFASNPLKKRQRTNMGHSGEMPSMETRKAMRSGAHHCTVCGGTHDEHKGMYKGE